MLLFLMLASGFAVGCYVAFRIQHRNDRSTENAIGAPETNEDGERISAEVVERQSETRSSDRPPSSETRERVEDATATTEHEKDPSQPGFALPNAPNQIDADADRVSLPAKPFTASPAFQRAVSVGLVALDLPAAFGLAIAYYSQQAILHLLGEWVPYIFGAGGFIALLLMNSVPTVLPSETYENRARWVSIIALGLLVIGLVVRYFVGLAMIL